MTQTILLKYILETAEFPYFIGMNKYEKLVKERSISTVYYVGKNFGHSVMGYRSTAAKDIYNEDIVCYVLASLDILYLESGGQRTFFFFLQDDYILENNFT